MSSLSIDEAIEKVGFGKFQKKLLVICGLGWAADAMEVLLISFALPAVSVEWSLNNAQKGLLGTVIFLGMLAGAWVWGRLSDVIGRKTSFVATVLLASLFGLFSYRSAEERSEMDQKRGPEIRGLSQETVGILGAGDVVRGSRE
jgi:MFS transporter, putative metabolite:H+ symporter